MLEAGGSVMVGIYNSGWSWTSPTGTAPSFSSVSVTPVYSNGQPTLAEVFAAGPSGELAVYDSDPGLTGWLNAGSTAGEQVAAISLVNGQPYQAVMTASGTIVIEYWNGSAWVPVTLS